MKGLCTFLFYAFMCAVIFLSFGITNVSMGIYAVFSTLCISFLSILIDNKDE